MGFLSMRSFPELPNILKITEECNPRLQAWVNEAICEESRYKEILDSCIDNYFFRLFITFFYFLLHRNLVVLSELCHDAVTACPSKDRLKIFLLFSLRTFGWGFYL